MITQFQGESRKEAIINHLCLDIEDEERFFVYLSDMGYDINAEDDIIEALHKNFIDRL